jgi:hypothetical protein
MDQDPGFPDAGGEAGCQKENREDRPAAQKPIQAEAQSASNNGGKSQDDRDGEKRSHSP